MGIVYTNPQGLRVYDYNGQTFDVKTGNPVVSQTSVSQQPGVTFQRVGDPIPNTNLLYEEEDIQNLAAGSGYEQTQQDADDVPIFTGTLQTGDPVLDSTLQQLNEFIKKLEENGQVLNPNIEITPEKIAEFLKQAETEINPYYSTQLKLARENLYQSLGYSQEEQLRNEQTLEQQYGKQVRQIGEQAAEQGFALSGLRQEQERQLAQETQQQIDTSRRTLQFGAGTAARQFAQQFGKPGAAPTIPEAPRVLPGENKFASTGRQLPFYELSPDIYDSLIGEQEFARRGAVKSRASGLEEAFRTQQGINQQRSLIL